MYMIKLTIERLYIEFDNMMEFDEYLKKYIKEGYTFIRSGTFDKNVWFEVEKRK